MFEIRLHGPRMSYYRLIPSYLINFACALRLSTYTPRVIFSVSVFNLMMWTIERLPGFACFCFMLSCVFVA